MICTPLTSALALAVASAPYPHPTKQQERLCASYVLQKKGDGERVPSYTDRILFHSMRDVERQLHLVAYQMCDAITGSDHKPVSAAFNLAVNRDVSTYIHGMGGERGARL